MTAGAIQQAIKPLINQQGSVYIPNLPILSRKG
jgi:hypothetical protein